MRMQAEASHTRTAGTDRHVHAFRVDLISNPGHAAAGIGTVRGFAGYRCGVKSCEPRLISPKRISLLRIVIGSQPATMETFQNSFSESRGQPYDFFIIRGEQNLKLRPAVVIGGINAVDDNCVEVQVGIQGRPKTLYERDRTALGFPHGAEFAGPPDQRCEDSSREDAEDVGH